MKHYRTYLADSARWEGFEFRTGDVVVTTPPKCGTTWMQMMCALLIFQDPNLPKPLDTLSPWLEIRVQRRDEVFAELAGQRHRRLIKSHTPLDGIPVVDGVTYISVGRDPRDACVSLRNHMANTDFAAAAKALAQAGDSLSGSLQAPPTDLAEFIRWWTNDDTPPTEAFGTLRYNLHHLDTCWRPPAGAKVELFHYDDMRADLDGQMRRLASTLETDVPASQWPALVSAASFGQMRSRADAIVGPNPTLRDAAGFFHRGSSGQWREVMTEPDLRRYDERVAELAEPDLAKWVHTGWGEQATAAP